MLSQLLRVGSKVYISRFDGRTIRVDKASERAPRNDGGFQGRGGYNQRGGNGGGYGGYGGGSRGGYGDGGKLFILPGLYIQGHRSSLYW